MCGFCQPFACQQCEGKSLVKQLARPLLYILLIAFCGLAIMAPPQAPVARIPIDAHLLWISVGALALAFATSWFVCWLIIRYEDMHSHFSHDHVDSGPQKFHALPTPRIGGISLAVGLLAGGSVLFALPPQISLREHGYLILASMPAFLGGLIEDVTKRVGVTERLLMTMLSAAIGAVLLGAVLNRLNLPMVDPALQWMPLAIVLTVVAVGGVANAINIIDGYNGLAGGLALIVLICIAWVANQVGDVLVLSSAFALGGGVLGFMLWNWPGGKVFLGDGGAYLLGFLLAELSVLLVMRNPGVSAWFPLVLLVHPIVETLFSIYRRKWVRGHTPGRPDALHLHQLLYSRVIRYQVGPTPNKQKLRRNSMVAPYIWLPALLTSLLGSIYYSNTAVLVLLSAAYGVFYIGIYRLLTSWRTPPWMKHSSK